MKANEVIIYSDMDGTMLTDWSMGPYVPKANLEAMKSFISEGGMFSIASGRQFGETLSFFDGISFSAPLVQSNGAVIYDSRAGRILKKTPLPERVKLECLEYCRQRKDVWLIAADEYDLYQIESEDRDWDSKLMDLKRKMMTAEDFLALEPAKICMAVPDASVLPRILRDIEGFESAGLFCSTQSTAVFVELMEKSVGKAPAVAEAVRFAGAEGRMLVCIGDYDNDCGMLELADVAACPKNSSPRVMALADIVTCGNNDGSIADLLRQLGLYHRI